MPKRNTSSTWLTRPQVAALAKLTEDEVAALDGKELHPVREGDRSWRYEPSEVTALLQRQAGAAASAGEITARAFEMFQAGKNDIDVVIATRHVAAQVRALRAEYNEMAGAIAVPPCAVATLRRLFSDSIVANPEMLGDVIERELAARHDAGYREGQQDAEDLGEIVNPATGERLRVRRPAGT